MKIGIIGILLSLFLAGCSKEENNKTKKDFIEEISEKEYIEKNDTEKSEENQEGISEESQKETMRNQYFYLKACEKMMVLKIDALEESYKLKNISERDYRNQKQELEQEENQYQLEREALDYQENLFEPVDIQDSDKKAMKKRLIEVENEVEDLERQMQNTEQDYMEQKLSQEDFILKRSKQEEEEERLEQEEDWLKKKLG